MRNVQLSENAYMFLSKLQAQKQLATGKRSSVGYHASAIIEKVAPKILAGETVSEKDLII